MTTVSHNDFPQDQAVIDANVAAAKRASDEMRRALDSQRGYNLTAQQLSACVQLGIIHLPHMVV